MIENLPYPSVFIPSFAIFAVLLYSHRRSQLVFRACIITLGVVLTAGTIIVPPAPLIFLAFTLLVLTLTLTIGGTAEREAVVMSYVLMLLPYLAALVWRGTNKEFDPVGALTDFLFMIWLGIIAHRHDKFWSYFASACFMLAVASHLMAYLNPDFQSKAYSLMRILPGATLMFLLLGVAVHGRYGRSGGKAGKLALDS